MQLKRLFFSSNFQNIFHSNDVCYDLHANKKMQSLSKKKQFFFFGIALYCIIVTKMNILFYWVFTVLRNNIMSNSVSTDIRPIWFDPSYPKWTIDCSVNISFEDIKCLYKVWNKHLPLKNPISKRFYISSLHFHIKLKKQNNKNTYKSFQEAG